MIAKSGRNFIFLQTSGTTRYLRSAFFYRRLTMNKVRKLVVVCLSVLFMTALMASCGKTPLTAPVDLTINENYVLSWKAVPDARSYTLSVEKLEEDGVVTNEKSNLSKFDFSKYAEGDYSVRVKAIAGFEDMADSDWSEAFTFHRDRETNCTYTLINNNTAYEVTSCSKLVTGDMVLEDTYRGKPVTRIADNAFKGTRLSSITIGNNVTYIGDSAFYTGTRLTKVVIPDSVTYIGEKAFQGCRSLEEIRLSANITEIKDNTFAYCEVLGSIAIPEGVVSIGESAFTGCRALTEFKIPESTKTIGARAFSEDTAVEKVTLGSNIDSFGEFAFYKCTALKEIVFSENSKTKTIGKSCFAGCTALTAVTIPDGVETIADYCFSGDDLLAAVTLPDSLRTMGLRAFESTAIAQAAKKEKSLFVVVDGWIAEGIGLTEKEDFTEITPAMFPSGVIGIASEVFLGCKALRSVEFSDSLKYVGFGAFYNCQALRKVIAPRIETVGNYAFAECVILNNVQFSDRVTDESSLKTIGSYAFYNCKTLNNNTYGGNLVPDTVESIGVYAFYGTALWNEPDSQGLVYAGNWLVGFNNLTKTTVTLDQDREEKTVGIADYAFYKCATLTGVNGLASLSVKTIGQGAFWMCSELRTITLGANLKVIKPYTFYKCSNLYSVSFPARITEIGERAFYGCSLLSRIDLGDCDKLKTIGDRAFYGCQNLSVLELGTSVETIGDYAFYNKNDDATVNTGLQTLVIPASVRSIGKYAFANFKGLTTLTIAEGLENIGQYAFRNCVAMKTIVLPDSLLTVSRSAFYKANAIETVTFGKNLREIGDYAFYGMTDISKLVLPASVRSIGKFAFRGLGVTSFVLGNNIETLGAHAFYGCAKATFYAEAEGIRPLWAQTWNSSFMPVVWNCVLSEDKSYVVSFTMKKDGIENATEKNPLGDPEREGYAFVGWATEENSKTVAYKSENVAEAPEGTVLYAIWQQKTQQTEDPA